mgnify:CR=1 FL=1
MAAGVEVGEELYRCLTLRGQWQGNGHKAEDQGAQMNDHTQQVADAQTIIEQRTFKKTDYPAIVDPDTESARQYGLKLAAKRKGQNAPLRAVEAVLASTTHSLIDGMKLERKLFVESRDSVQSAAIE